MNEIKSQKVWSAQVVDKDGRKVLELPSDFAADGEVTIRQEGAAFIIEPVAAETRKPASWAEFFDNLEPVDVEWPDLDEGLLPAEDVDLLK